MRNVNFSVRSFGRIGVWYATLATASLILIIAAAAISRMWVGVIPAAEASERFTALALVVVPLCVGFGVVVWLKVFAHWVHADRRLQQANDPVGVVGDAGRQMPPTELLAAVYKIRKATEEYDAATRRYAALLKATGYEVQTSEAHTLKAAVYDHLSKVDQDLVDALREAEAEKIRPLEIRARQHEKAKERELGAAAASASASAK